MLADRCSVVFIAFVAQRGSTAHLADKGCVIVCVGTGGCRVCMCAFLIVLLDSWRSECVSQAACVRCVSSLALVPLREWR